MTISLPDTPAHRKQKIFQISFAENQEPMLGGPETRIARLGTRLGVSVELPPMNYLTAMAWIARLMRSDEDESVFPFRQSGFTPAQAQNWTAQAAAANTYYLPVTRPGADALPVEGQFFSIVKNGRRYLHVVTGAITAGGFNIFPALRTSMAGAETVEFPSPKIQGQVNRDRITEWEIDRALTVGVSFDLRETR